jgi:transcriptional regulator with XRE-family HTH domain
MRKNANLNQQELADAMGWSLSTVVNYEKKNVQMRLVDFERFIMVTTTTTEDRQKKSALLNSISAFFEELSNDISPSKAKD